MSSVQQPVLVPSLLGSTDREDSHQVSKLSRKELWWTRERAEVQSRE